MYTLIFYTAGKIMSQNKSKNLLMLQLYIRGPGIPTALHSFISRLLLLSLDNDVEIKIDSIKIMDALLELPPEEFETLLTSPASIFTQHWPETKKSIRLSVVLNKQVSDLFDIL